MSATAEVDEADLGLYKAADEMNRLIWLPGRMNFVSLIIGFARLLKVDKLAFAT